MITFRIHKPLVLGAALFLLAHLGPSMHACADPRIHSEMERKTEDPRVEDRAKYGRLHVEAKPLQANIRILNSRRSYYPGLEMEPGEYLIEVTSDHHETQIISVTISPGAEKRLAVSLGPSTRSEPRLTMQPEMSTEPLSKFPRTVNPRSLDWAKESAKHLQDGKWGEAIRTASIAISYDPGLVEPYLYRSEAYRKTGFLDPAINDCNVAVSINPKSAAPYTARARAFMAKGFFEAAMKDCSTALEIDPRNLLAIHARGDIYREAGNLDGAKADFYDACDSGLRQACESYRAVTGYLHSDILALIADWIAGSTIAFRESNFDEVIRLCSEILRFSPQNVIALSNRSGAYSYKGQIEEALADSNKAIQVDPRFAIAYNNRGFALELSGRTHAALLDYETSCSLGFDLGCRNHEKVSKR